MTDFVRPPADARLAELHALATAALNGDITDAQIARLERLVREDAELRKLYVRYMYVSWNLRTWAKYPLTDALAEPWGGGEGEPATSGEWLAASQGAAAWGLGVGVQGAGVPAGNLPSAIHHPRSPSPEIPKSLIPQIPIPALGFLGNAWQGTKEFFSQEVPFAILITLGIFAIAGLIGSQITISHPTQFVSLPGFSVPRTTGNPSADGERTPLAPTRPEKPEPTIPEVAQITGMVDCEFSDNLAPMHNRIGIGHNNKFALSKGLMEITYFSGAKVILQGPCTYEIDSVAGGYLSIGKLTARVETAKPQASNQKSEIINHKSSNPQSPIPNPFAVKTPTAVVTDLGTEFGVEVDESGGTRSYVYQGRVVLVALDADGKLHGKGIELGEEESARVEKTVSGASGEPVVIARRSKNEPIKFIRKMPRHPQVKAIDLADIVAGGNGILRRRGAGIDPDAGTPVSLCHTETLRGRGDYCPIPWNKLIDGVFIPKGAAGPVQLDSAKHVFDGFPKTTGTAYGPIWSGPGIQVGWWEGKNMEIGTVLKGTDYGSAKHSILGMIPNKGITFDLAAIRGIVPERRLVRFRAVVGNNEIVSSDPKMQRVSADAWVFVDGQVRFSKTNFNARDGAFEIDVPLDDANRFLTLVTTDAGNGIHSDWIFFGDPVLELEEAQGAGG